MTHRIFEDGHYYICHDGRELHHLRTETKEQEGYTQPYEVYGCADCSGCEHKARCLYKYDAEKNADRNKVMKINEQWEELKEESHANIQSEKGILKRQIRSIQTEGHFGYHDFLVRRSRDFTAEMERITAAYGSLRAYADLYKTFGLHPSR